MATSKQTRARTRNGKAQAKKRNPAGKGARERKSLHQRREEKERRDRLAEYNRDRQARLDTELGQRVRGIVTGKAA